jgi:hypothetical protein
MMEPEYEYRKGEGWVASYGATYVLYDGQPVRIEMRTPKCGERYFRLRTNGPWYVNGKPDLEGRVRPYLKDKYMYEFFAWPMDDHSSTHTYFVVVPV